MMLAVDTRIVRGGLGRDIFAGRLTFDTALSRALIRLIRLIRLIWNRSFRPFGPDLVQPLRRGGLEHAGICMRMLRMLRVHTVR